MFRAICKCEKFNVLRANIMHSWINRKCKNCKSNLKVYSDMMLVFDYNNPVDRCKSRMNNYSLKKLSKPFPGIFYIGKHKSMPKIISLPPPPPPSPIIRDVFMGYIGEPNFSDTFEMNYLMNPNFKEKENEQMIMESECPFDFQLN